MNRRNPYLLRRGARSAPSGGAAAAWSPNDIASIQDRWLPENALEADTAGFASGVTASPGTQDLVQTVTANQPALTTDTILGGVEYFDFDGTNDCLRSLSYTHGDTSAISVLIACHIATITNGRYFFSYGTPRLNCITANRFSCQFPSGAAVIATIPLGQTLALILQWDPVNGGALYNGETLLGSQGSGSGGAMTSPALLAFPSWASGSAANEGSIADISICAGILSAGERTNWASFCADNYAYTP